MSYDLAVWEGPTPADDEAALQVFEDLYERHVEGPASAPSPAIVAYVQALLARHPDASTNSPWATSPLLDEASGPLVYFPMSYSVSDEDLEYCVSEALDRGLVCLDPQAGRVYTRSAIAP